MPLYKDRYRVASTRLKGWDYSAPGFYFITICTKGRMAYFGKVSDGEIIYSSLGQAAHDYWAALPGHFQHLGIDEFVIMPNHIHGILVLESKGNVQTEMVETQHAASLRRHEKPSGIKPGSVPAIVRSYKSAVTRWAGQNGHREFAWQSRFYDHIIRDEQSLERIRAYIQGNPIKWESDEYFA